MLKETGFNQRLNRTKNISRIKKSDFRLGRVDVDVDRSRIDLHKNGNSWKLPRKERLLKASHDRLLEKSIPYGASIDYLKELARRREAQPLEPKKANFKAPAFSFRLYK